MKASQVQPVGTVAREPGDTTDAARTHFWQQLTVVILASLVLRLVVLWKIAGVPLASDSTDYRGMALLLLGGQPFVPYWPPGLSFYLAPFLAAGMGDVALRASMLLWWILFCLGFVRLAEDLHLRRRSTLVLLAIFSVTPALIHFSIEPMTQMPSAALLIWAVSASVRCSRDSGWTEALLLGASLGGLALIRPSALPLMLALPALAFLRKRRLREPLFAVGVGLLLIFAWVVRVHHLSGQWTINNSNGANLYYGNNPATPLYRTWYFGSHAKLGTDEIHQFPDYERVVRQVMKLPATDRSAEFQRRAVAYVLHRPDLFLLRTLNRVRCFWGFDIFTAANMRGAGGEGRRWFLPVFAMDALCYLAVAGYAFFWIAAAPASLWRRWETWVLVGAVLLYALPYWATMSHPTYHFPVVAPLALLGVMAHELARSTGWKANGRGWAALAALGLIQLEWIYFLTKS